MHADHYRGTLGSDPRRHHERLDPDTPSTSWSSAPAPPASRWARARGGRALRAPGRQGPLTSNLLRVPRYMKFFTTRDRLEIPDVPFTSSDDKPDLQQALIYYRAVVDHYDSPVAPHETVLEATPGDTAGIFRVLTRVEGEERVRRARNVVLATGYFGNPRRLGVPGEDEPWVHSRYLEPYRHHGERVVLVGGGNSSCEAALELWRNGVASVTMVVRKDELKQSVKYWVKPDVENRIAEGSIDALFDSEVESFADHVVRVRTPDGPRELPADAAYVLIGYDTDASLLARCGVTVDPETLVPRFDEDSCETDVPGFYVAGAVQSGRDTNRIFIDNSRDHGARIVRDVLEKRVGERREATRQVSTD
ncbi:MAG: NAD(P)-binding domain-containing protein [Thermoanaerobaculia bacterium]